MERVHVVYDGLCGFCTRALAWIARFDSRCVLEFHDGNQRAEIVARFPQLSDADFDSAMYVLREGEEPQRGFFAFRRMLWVSPFLLVLAPLFYFPGASVAGPRIYAWVARNRQSFGCRSGACEIPRPPAGGRRAA